ncbi:MAG: hypothetical protein ACXAEF_10110 [Candidatus Thorarchaeota archaeon]|jgi:phage-related holin
MREKSLAVTSICCFFISIGLIVYFGLTVFWAFLVVAPFVTLVYFASAKKTRDEMIEEKNYSKRLDRRHNYLGIAAYMFNFLIIWIVSLLDPVLFGLMPALWVIIFVIMAEGDILGNALVRWSNT